MRALLIALLIVATPTPTRAWAESGPRSLVNDPARLEAAIDRYVDLHRAAAADTRLTNLSAELSALKNGGTPSDLLRNAGLALSGTISNRPADPFNWTIRRLLARYSEVPAERDALAELIQAIGARVEPELAREVRDDVAETVVETTMWAWTALTIWEWRGGGKGLVEDAGRLGSGLAKAGRWIIGRGGKKAAEGATTLAVRAIPNLDEAASALAKVPDTADEAVALAKSTWRNHTITRKAVAGFRRFIIGLGKSLVAGTAIGGLSAWEQYGARAKVDPRMMLRMLQAMEIEQLEQQATALHAETQSWFGEDVAMDSLYQALTPGNWVEDGATQLERRIAALRALSTHFHTHAPEFAGRVSLKEANRVITLVPTDYHLNQAASALQEFRENLLTLRTTSDPQVDEFFLCSFEREAPRCRPQ